MRPIQAALAFAADIDRTLVAGCDDETGEAILAVGDLVGGMTIHGTQADLMRHLDALANGDPSGADIGWGAGLNGWELERVAYEWLRDAREIMARVTARVLEAAE